MDIASLQGTTLQSQTAMQRGGNGPLGEQPNEVSQAMATPPQTEGPDQGGLTATTQPESSGGDGNTRGDEQALTYTAAGVVGGGNGDQPPPGGALNVTA